MIEDKDEFGEATNYLHEALNDAQGTLRVLDAKAYITLLIFLLPFYKVETISYFLFYTPGGLGSHIILFFLKGAVVVSWVMGVASCLSALFRIDNPRDHIRGDLPEGTFYLGGLFQLNSTKNLTRRTSTLSRRSLNEVMGSLPKNKNEISRELTFELMKVVYIRTLKDFRVRFSFYFISAWLFFGFLLISAIILEREEFL